MRLLDTRTGRFVWVEDPRREHYAVLSHVWAKPGNLEYPEQTYQDLLEFQKEDRPEGTLPSKLSDKLRRFCEAALKDGFELGWADTCCIDKTSSSELSEAINSMYSWYGYSGACYAFLADVESPSVDSKWRAAFAGSQWFRRGWTLQELIAPHIVIFVSRGWEVLGSKHSLAARISSVTNIDIKVLTLETSLEEIPIARRMEWMQCRETTRLEDEAYCLMGIFGVNMQTNYGEGRYAFIRLQENILLQSPDQTIFAWGPLLDEPSSNFKFLPWDPPTVPPVGMPVTPPNPSHDPTAPLPTPRQCLIASSSKDFTRRSSEKLVCLSRQQVRQRLGLPIAEDLYQAFEITPYGLRGHFPVVCISSFRPDSEAPTHCAVLACEDPSKGLLAVLLQPRRRDSASYDHEFFAGGRVALGGEVTPATPSVGPAWDCHYRLMYITHQQLQALRTSTASTSSLNQPPRLPRVSIVYVPHCPPQSVFERDRDTDIHSVLCATFDHYTLEFCPLARRALKREGYEVKGPIQSQDEPITESTTWLSRTPGNGSKNTITISGHPDGIELTIQVNRCSCDVGRRDGALGVLVSSNQDAEALDGSFQLWQRDHNREHPLHVHSWSFDRGSASRRIDLPEIKNDSRKLWLRLTLTSFAPRPGTTPGLRRYRLGAYLREVDNTPSPSQAQLDSSAQLISQPPLIPPGPPLSENETSVALSEKEPSRGPPSRQADDQKRLIGKGTGSVQTVGLMALGGVMAFAMLSLNRYIFR